MKTIRILGMTLLATGVLGAFAAESAFAEDNWLVSGVTINPGVTFGVTNNLEFHIATLVFGIDVAEVLCNAFLESGVTVNGLDEVSEFLNLLEEKISSTPLSGLALECEGDGGECTGLKAELWPVNLPWSSEILLMAAGTLEFLDTLFKTGAQPGFEVQCLNADGTVHVENTCEGATSGALENMAGEGDVLIIFSAAEESEKGTCTTGGAGAGDFEGEGLLTLNGGLSLAASA